MVAVGQPTSGVLKNSDICKNNLAMISFVYIICRTVDPVVGENGRCLLFKDLTLTQQRIVLSFQTRISKLDSTDQCKFSTLTSWSSVRSERRRF